jgi:hypothetical protein
MTSNQVREYARKKYVEPALAAGERKIRVRAGDVHKALALRNRVPVVCQALESKTFLRENNLVLEAKEGPPSGLSTSVVFTYRIDPENSTETTSSKLDVALQVSPSNKFLGLMQLYGAGKEVFAALGGGENFIRAERKAFADAIEKQDRERGIL